MEKHVRLVAVLNIAVGAAGLLFGLVYLYLSGGINGIMGIKPNQEDFSYRSLPLETFVELGVLAFFLAISPVLIVAGMGLLKWQEWARLLTITVSAFNLLDIPIGTVLAVYSWWALLSPEVEPLFEDRHEPGGRRV
jgi:hypothetical protein